ncbi:MAG: hypothetical protein ACREM8_00010 [Vulcanimicrobiaceae bacterium]
MSSFSSRLLAAACVVLSATAGVEAGQTISAPAHLRALNAEMREARAHAKWEVLRTAALEQVRFLNGSPDALLELALADTRAGAQAEALGALEAFVRMGQATVLVRTLPAFDTLRTNPKLAPILVGMAANLRPESDTALAFTLPDAGLLPEDIAYDSVGKRILLTSALERKIVSLDAAGRMTEFARAPDSWPMLALKIDGRRGIVWATEVALAGFRDVPKRAWGRSAVVGYDLASGKLLRRIEGPRDSQLGDMSLAPNGDLLISDSLGGRVYLLRRGSGPLRRVDRGDFISPETPAFAPGEDVAFVPDYVRGIGVIDLATGRVRWLPMEDRFALEGIDGMYLCGRMLVAVQNGTSPERIVAFRLNPGFTHVLAQHTLASGTARLDPTHGAIVGNELAFISNAGWNELDASGRVKSGEQLTPARILRAPLPGRC